MNRSDRELNRLPSFDPAIVGTLCCIASALGYTGANICLRKLAVLNADEMWVICIKELVTVVAVGPWLLLQGVRGIRLLPPKNALLALMLTGLAVQFAGNLSVQWALGVIGISITIPVVFAVILTVSAAMGLVFLGERVPARSVAAIALLVVSIALLSFGAGRTSGPSSIVRSDPIHRVFPEKDRMNAVTTNASQQAAEDVPHSAGPLWPLLAVGAAMLGGCMYAVLSTVIRSTVTARVPVTTVVFIITGMGVLSLGGLSVGRLGVDTLLHTDREQLAWMLAAGTFNLFAFLAITKGLQLTSLVRANLLNGSQVAMAAVAGMLLFNEMLDHWATLGVALTIAGILLIGQPKVESKDEDS